MILFDNAQDAGQARGCWFAVVVRVAQWLDGGVRHLPMISMGSLLLRSCHSRLQNLSVALLLALAAMLAHGQQAGILADARAAMEAKQYEEAEKLYRKALVDAPNSAALLTDMALSLQMQGRSAEAIRSYSQALRQGYIPETYALLAEERCKMGDLAGARPMLARIFREERKNLRVLAAVAPCYLEIDEPVESAIVYQTLAESKEYPADLRLVELAKSYLRSGQLFAGKLSKIPGSEPFLAALRDASSSGSAGARGAFTLAAKTSVFFDADLSWADAEARWEKHPQDVALLYLLSVLSAEEGMRQIQLCDEQFPGSPYLEQFHADVLADQGQGDEAAAEYEQLLREHPDLSDLRYSLGLLREHREEWPAAAESFRQQLAASPTDERAAAHLSRCMIAMEQYAEVRDFLLPRMSAAHPPQWASLLLAEAQEKLGKPDEAVRILVAAERETNPDKQVHYRLMHLYTLAGRTADAKREYALFQAASKP
jgi:tetratricopeptide (TPR) repeat protein